MDDYNVEQREEANLEAITNLYNVIGPSVKESNKLPKGENFRFASSQQEYRQVMSNCSQLVSASLSKLIKFAEPSRDLGTIFEKDNLSTNYKSLVRIADNLLEKVDIQLDQLSSNKDNIAISYDATKAMMKHASKGGRQVKHQDIEKPQSTFETKIDNFSPYVPKCQPKVYSQHPLILQEGIHPFEKEITELLYSSENLSIPTELYRPGDLESTACSYIDTKEHFDSMLGDLKSETEIAIDLENHSIRSYQGILCLMQISTRKQDYVIDTLKLRSEISRLSTIFTNPNVVKVLHGADQDIVWLQRDFSLYVVNMFDTGQATRVLNYPSFGLAYLLKKFCNFDAQKEFQVADWRVRPLPEELLKYAQSDTHFLLYIYDSLRMELRKRALDMGTNPTELLKAVFLRSRDICLKKYSIKDVEYDIDRFFIKNPGYEYNLRKKSVMRQLLKKRDEVGRKQDENAKYVMSDNLLIQVALKEATEAKSVLACTMRPSEVLKLTSKDFAQAVQEGVSDYETRNRNQDQAAADAMDMSGEASQLKSFVPTIKAPYHLRSKEDEALKAQFNQLLDECVVSIKTPSSISTFGKPEEDPETVSNNSPLSQTQEITNTILSLFNYTVTETAQEENEDMAEDGISPDPKSSTVVKDSTPSKEEGEEKEDGKDDATDSEDEYDIIARSKSLSLVDEPELDKRFDSLNPSDRNKSKNRESKQEEAEQAEQDDEDGENWVPKSISERFGMKSRRKKNGGKKRKNDAGQQQRYQPTGKASWNTSSSKGSGAKKQVSALKFTLGNKKKQKR